MVIDPTKIQIMLQWLKLNSLKSLRGFLRLNGYYWRFIKDYNKISQPLTFLLKKDNTCWEQSAEEAFKQLKHIMCFAPVLALLNFQKEFVIECNKFGNGVGVLLLQYRRPIAYLSKVLALNNLDLSAYEKEMLAVLQAIRKWSSYLIGRYLR